MHINQNHIMLGTVRREMLDVGSTGNPGCLASLKEKHLYFQNDTTKPPILFAHRCMRNITHQSVLHNSCWLSVALKWHSLVWARKSQICSTKQSVAPASHCHGQRSLLTHMNVIALNYTQKWKPERLTVGYLWKYKTYRTSPTVRS